jgi:hypothetical protein
MEQTMKQYYTRIYNMLCCRCCYNTTNKFIVHEIEVKFENLILIAAKKKLI